MDDRTYKLLLPVVRQAARSAARRWSTLDVPDLENEAWQIALEALPRYRSELGTLVGYVSRSLKVGLRNACYRLTMPVHLPKNREWSVVVLTARMSCGGPSSQLNRTDRATYHSDTRASCSGERPAPRDLVSGCMEEQLDLARACRQVRERVDEYTEGRPGIRSVVLSGGDLGPLDLSAAYGGTPDRYQRETRRVYGRLRDEVHVKRSVLEVLG